MTVASITSVSAQSSVGGSPASGRSVSIEGSRTVGRYRIVLQDLYEAGGGALNFDPKAFGFPLPVGSVTLTPRPLIANVALLRYTASYDYVAKKIILFDQTDHDEPATDDVTGLILDAVVTSE